MDLLVSDMIAMGEKQLLEAGIENPKLEVEQIYCQLKKIDKMGYFQRWSKKADEGEIEAFFQMIKRRGEREPLQHILGEVEFLGYPFKVRKNVLIPRMDTEAVVLQASEHIKNKDKVLDLCSGSGIIGISLYKIMEAKKMNIKLTAVDLSQEALELTGENAKLNKVDLDIIKSDLFENKKIKRYNLIVSNPPYIRSGDIPNLQYEVREHDPLMALDGGENGLVFYERIIDQAPNHLKKNGYLVFEIGYDQGVEVAQLMKEKGFVDIEITKDLSGRDRAVKGCWKSK